MKYGHSFFNKPPLDQAKQQLKEAKEKLARLEMDHKAAQDREEHFVEVLTRQLINIYDTSKSLAPDAQEPGWSDKIKQYMSDGAILSKYILTAGGVGALASWIIGKGDIAVKVAAGAAIPAGLCALWSIKNAEDAREKARGFLIIVEDVKNSRLQIEKRMKDIAERLALRFRYAIQKLLSSENGVERLASFFSTAIARDLPSPEIRRPLLTQKLTPEEIIQKIAEVAVPQKIDDPLYSGWFTQHKLETVDEENSSLPSFFDRWTVSGLLLKAPLCVLVPKEKYYVRDGKLGGDKNRADKYPPQIVFRQLPRYLAADDENLRAIKKNSPILKKIKQAERACQVAMQKVQQFQVQQEPSADDASVQIPLSLPSEASVSLINRARLLAAEVRKEEAAHHLIKKLAETSVSVVVSGGSLAEHARLSAAQVSQEWGIACAVRRNSLIR